ncbi:hypothetical protein ACQY0O_004142 [Thecaphora frezii]
MHLVALFVALVPCVLAGTLASVLELPVPHSTLIITPHSKICMPESVESFHFKMENDSQKLANLYYETYGGPFPHLEENDPQRKDGLWNSLNSTQILFEEDGSKYYQKTLPCLVTHRMPVYDEKGLSRYLQEQLEATLATGWLVCMYAGRHGTWTTCGRALTGILTLALPFPVGRCRQIPSRTKRTQSTLCRSPKLRRSEGGLVARAPAVLVACPQTRSCTSLSNGLFYPLPRRPSLLRLGATDDKQAHPSPFRVNTSEPSIPPCGQVRGGCWPLHGLALRDTLVRYAAVLSPDVAKGCVRACAVVLCRTVRLLLSIPHAFPPAQRPSGKRLDANAITAEARPQPPAQWSTAAYRADTRQPKDHAASTSDSSVRIRKRQRWV